MSENDLEGIEGDILIVDDDPLSLQTLSAMLLEQGYGVRWARDSGTALMIIHNAPPDLILLDVRMPGIDGFELCQRLKANEEIILSQHAQEAGCDLVVLLTSYFQCATQQAIEEWWREVCDKLEIGAVFYDSPLSQLATSDTLAGLALEIPNIVGVKDGRPDLMWCSDVERKADYKIWVSDPLEDHWPQEMKVMRNPVMCTCWHLWLLQQPDYTPIRDYSDLIKAGKWEEGLNKYNEIEPGRQLLNEFFWPNYRKGVYVVAFWKYWLELKGVVSGHKVRSPLLNMTEEEEEWLKGRVELLAKGEGPTTMKPLKPYPQHVLDTSSSSLLGI